MGAFLEALSTIWNENAILDTYANIQKLRERLVLAILASIREQVIVACRQQQSAASRTETEIRELRNLGCKFLLQSKSDFRRWERDLIDAIYSGHNSVRSGCDPAGISSRLSSEVDKSKTTGKAGSGKSTLVKYLFENSRTCSKLGVWSGSKPLTLAAFFFWGAETPLQKSKEALLRSPLSQALINCGDLVTRISFERWESYSLFDTGIERSWSWVELRQAFRLLIKEACSSKRFCFLIDGLYEFDGHLSDLVALLRECTSSPDVKFCVASRPWVIFEDAFHNVPSHKLQYLTSSGIQIYISAHLSENPAFNELHKPEPEYASNLI
ncbi:hypothetical protein CC78DRAFT_612995 [Lojkania enalia]|uniref:Nephrocystin 3-like N-terminal domain-containing protein n=1 Tax=Lojkania enalia TaxID=147567 RepID=A0A9P4KGK8_9PLEO|nr:hypothetical protein CC78DRAFT_612995 [Didymosphaeria enalia]